MEVLVDVLVSCSFCLVVAVPVDVVSICNIFLDIVCYNKDNNEASCLQQQYGRSCYWVDLLKPDLFQSCPDLLVLGLPSHV